VARVISSIQFRVQTWIGSCFASRFQAEWLPDDSLFLGAGLEKLTWVANPSPSRARILSVHNPKPFHTLPRPQLLATLLGGIRPENYGAEEES